MKKTFFNGNELQKEFQEYDRDYYSLDGYEALLMFYDEIDCRDLFEENDEREKIMIFEIGS